ncbi:CLUMA_CG013824, isoform A [Clunio marinus]|uniref:CLUMA_CG013824, isoform A n=1 Tax=Clunio marinus TaxID=568069 RepID=A0A1J1ILX2_9DIPT|nr:CLUMA_CG013824, isoform A [Clunio marinus]
MTEKIEANGYDESWLWIFWYSHKTCSHKTTPIFCYNGGTVINFTESKLRMLYTSQVFGKVAVFQLILTHDTGKSCFQAEIELNRNGED